MRWSFFLAALVVLASGASRWSRLATAPRASEPVTVYLFLHSNDLDAPLLERSMPSSPLFRHWVSPAELETLLAVRDAPQAHAWAAQHGVQCERVLHMMRCPTTVGAAQRLLGVPYARYRQGRSFILRPASEPRGLPPFIAAVARTFPTMRRVQRSRGLHFAVTPSLIRERYKTVDIHNQAPNNTQAVAQFLGQHYRQTDLEEFFTLFSKGDMGKRPTVVGPDSGLGGAEASLDIEYIMAVGSNVKTYFWSTGGTDNGGQETFLEWLMALSNSTNPPLLNSVSYGDDENTIPLPYAVACNQAFAGLGMRGISILFASGDSGVGGDSGCGPQNQFVPSFPAASPYVTAVGGTILSGVFETGYEMAWSGSGGGFSNYWARPSWQTHAVQQYLATVGAANLPNASQWNQTGRAFPDVAAFSTGFMVVVDLIPQPVDGTSCATPTFSAVLSLVNGARLAAGMPSLGFLNPWLYLTAAPNYGLTDVTQGSNPNCNSNGFPAIKGYDPVTGLGSPVYSTLVKLALQH